uniref:Zinc finger protein 268 n=1 Tax=Rhinolophus ferrumequinum TaxID=59479 RepID=A0A671F1A7_RHIFE
MATRVRTAAIWDINTPNLISSSSWNKRESSGRSPTCQVRASQTKSGKWRITWNGLREIKASWEVQQNTVNTLHLENYVFLLQILFPQDKSFINMTHMERV